MNIESLKQWAEKEPSIRALILTGSRAMVDAWDSLSDYDTAVFSTDISLFTESDAWLEQMGNPWVCVHEKLPWRDGFIPTRLVIFDPGVKVDFSFYPVEALKSIGNGPLADDIDAGYQILVDKDTEAAKLPKPTGRAFQEKPPEASEFKRVIDEFWFEVYHVAKYLARRDVWSAKMREFGLRQEFLLRMIRWNVQAKNQWLYTTHAQGKRIQDWVEAELWDLIPDCFSDFDIEANWRALDRMMEVFRKLGRETGDLLGYRYLEELDTQISELVKRYRAR